MNAPAKGRKAERPPRGWTCLQIRSDRPHQHISKPCADLPSRQLIIVVDFYDNLLHCSCSMMANLPKYVSVNEVLRGLIAAKEVDSDVTRAELEASLCLEEFPEITTIKDQEFNNFGIFGKKGYLYRFHLVLLKAKAAGELEAALHTAEKRGQSIEWFETIETGYHRLSTTAASEIAPILRGLKNEFEIAFAAHHSRKYVLQRPRWDVPVELRGGKVRSLDWIGFETLPLIALLDRADIRHPFRHVHLEKPAIDTTDALDADASKITAQKVEASDLQEFLDELIDVEALYLKLPALEKFLDHLKKTYRPRTHEMFIRTAYGLALQRGYQNAKGGIHATVWLALREAVKGSPKSFLNVEGYTSDNKLMLANGKSGKTFTEEALKKRYSDWEKKRRAKINSSDETVSSGARTQSLESTDAK